MGTLDQRNVSNGAAEMLKMACIKDEELFYMLEEYAEHFIEDKFQVHTPFKQLVVPLALACSIPSNTAC